MVQVCNKEASQPSFTRTTAVFIEWAGVCGKPGAQWWVEQSQPCPLLGLLSSRQADISHITTYMRKSIAVTTIALRWGPAGFFQEARMDGGREGMPGEPQWQLGLQLCQMCREMRGRPLAGGERGWCWEGSEVWGTGKGWRQRGGVVLMLIRKSNAEPWISAGRKLLLVGEAEIKTQAGDTLERGAQSCLSAALPPKHSLLASLEQMSIVCKTPDPGVRLHFLALTQLFPGAGPQFPCQQGQ